MKRIYHVRLCTGCGSQRCTGGACIECAQEGTRDAVLVEIAPALANRLADTEDVVDERHDDFYARRRRGMA